MFGPGPGVSAGGLWFAGGQLLKAGGGEGVLY